MKTVALIDPYRSGHHSDYIKLYTKSLLSLGHRVMVFYPEPLELKSWGESNCHRHRDNLHLFEAHEPEQWNVPLLRLQKALNGITWWRFAAKALRKAEAETGQRPDLVFFPWLDSYLGNYQSHHLIDTIFPHDWSGLYIHPRHLRRQMRYSNSRGGLHDYDEALRSRGCRAVAVLDEGIAATLQDKLQGKQVIIFPDVADASNPAHDFPLRHEIIAKAAGRKIITLMGGLAKRKGILTLLEAAGKADARNRFFLFAGLLAESSFTPRELESIRKIASNPPDNCFFHFNFITKEAHFNALVELSDILYAGYEEFPHSSNILTKGALFKKPVIVSRGYCMEERVKAFSLGESIRYDDASHCIEAITRLLEEEKPAADFAGYKNLHSEERLRHAFQDLCGRYFRQ